MPAPDDVLPVAWEQHDDRLRVPRQLRVLMQVTFAHVSADLDVFLETRGWREVGVSSTQIMAYLKDNGIPYHCWVDEEHQIWTPANPQWERVAWTFLDGRAFFYKHGRALETHRPEAVSDVALKAEHQGGEMPPFCDWLQWDGEAAPGYY